MRTKGKYRFLCTVNYDYETGMDGIISTEKLYGMMMDGTFKDKVQEYIDELFPDRYGTCELFELESYIYDEQDGGIND